jgi:hypothetical protein
VGKYDKNDVKRYKEEANLLKYGKEQDNWNNDETRKRKKTRRI